MWAKHKVERKKGSYRKAQEVDLASTSFHPVILWLPKASLQVVSMERKETVLHDWA